MPRFALDWILAASQSERLIKSMDVAVLMSSNNHHPADSETSKNLKTTPKSPWAYASEGTQLALTVLLFVYVGFRLDAWRDTRPWFLLGGCCLGIGLGLYNFLKRVGKP